MSELLRYTTRAIFCLFKSSSVEWVQVYVKTCPIGAPVQEGIFCSRVYGENRNRIEAMSRIKERKKDNMARALSSTVMELPNMAYVMPHE